MIKKIKIIIFLCILLMFGISTKIFARIKTNDPTVKSGETVTINISSQEPVASGAINIKSNEGLTFQSASGGTVNGSLVAFSKANNMTSGIATYTFKAPEVNEDKTYKIVFESKDMADENGNTIASSSATATVTVKAPVSEKPSTPSESEKSNDATLKSITIGDKKYSGSSLKSTITYTADASAETIKISASKNNSKATVSGTGTKSLVAGQTNKFKIKVTAEDGTVKNYNVNVIRLAEESKTPNIIENPEENQTKEEELKLTSLVIKDAELSTAFSPDIYNYIANVENMSELEIDATANNENAQIKIEGANELKEGNNKITITVVLDEKSVEYVIEVYNKIEKELVENLEDNSASDTNIEKDFIGNIVETIKNNWQMAILIVIIVILVIISIICAVLAYKYKKQLNEMVIPRDETLQEDDDESIENIQNDDVAIGIKEENSKKPEKPKIGKHF